MIPNLVSIVEQTRRDFPRAWNKCHVEGDLEAWDFIILAGRRMYDQNPLFGLNGKRGGDTLSWDAVNWRGDNDDPPNVIDCVAGAGGTNPQPAWIVTNTTGKWFNPYDFNTEYNYSGGGGNGGGGGEEPSDDIEKILLDILEQEQANTAKLVEINHTLQMTYNMLDGHLAALVINTGNTDTKLDKIKEKLDSIRARMDLPFNIRVRL